MVKLMSGDPGSCWADATDAADTLNPLDEVEGLLPGIGDISGDITVGMWHHIQVLNGGSNEYDDHQGLLFSEAGPYATLDQVDLALLAGMDIAGVSIDFEDSNGPKRYESKGVRLTGFGPPNQGPVAVHHATAYAVRANR